VRSIKLVKGSSFGGQSVTRDEREMSREKEQMSRRSIHRDNQEPTQINSDSTPRAKRCASGELVWLLAALRARTVWHTHGDQWRPQTDSGLIPQRFSPNYPNCSITSDRIAPPPPHSATRRFFG
jgi:hypothetical protein